MSDSAEKFSPITIALHWLVGITIIALIAVGIYMESTEAFPLYPIHKSVGMLIFAVIIFRVIWRMKSGWPQHIGSHKPIERKLARIVQWVLIIGTVLFPLSGMIMSGFGGYGLSIFGLELVPMNFDPENPKEILAHNGALAGFAHSVHGILGNVMIVAILLHISGALKHHIIDKDSTLKKMLGKT